MTSARGARYALVILAVATAAVLDGGHATAALLAVAAGAVTVRLRDRDAREDDGTAAGDAATGDATAEELHRLRAETDRLRGQVDELSAFAATVAHDIKGPLASLLGFVTIGMRPGTPDDVREVVLGRAVGVGRRMDELVDGLLGYARAGGPQEDLAPVDLRTPVGLALEAVDHELSTSGADVELVDLRPVVADPDRLAQVVQNLVANALRHGAGTDARPVVRIGSVCRGEEVELYVEDHGTGIAPEQREAVLLPLVRGPDTAAPGTGLGLATSRRLVEAMGGRLTIGDASGGGARISVHLAAPPPEARPAREYTPRSTGLAGGAHVATRGAAARRRTTVAATTADA